MTADPAHPQQSERQQRIVTPPPAAQVLRARPGISPFSLDTLIAGPPAASGEAVIELDIDFTESKIYNPATDQYDLVRLRSYRDTKQAAPPKIPFVAPTIEIIPGETVRLTLHNKLPVANQNCPAPDGDVNTPHCFNRTNLHSHGLWVSPSGNGDNVLISINPGVDFQYEYNVPPDHPAGTFWYHPHLHGSTAIQVSSGMAGLLIIRGSRLPTPMSPGDIDTLLKEPTGAPFAERLVLLQQVQYACRDANGKIEVDARNAYFCKPGEVGGIDGYDQFGPNSWLRSGRYTSINGEVLPVSLAPKPAALSAGALRMRACVTALSCSLRRCALELATTIWPMHKRSRTGLSPIASARRCPTLHLRATGSRGVRLRSGRPQCCNPDIAKTYSSSSQKPATTASSTTRHRQPLRSMPM
ncbi:multicopper oxidase domain-containing protein [Sinorhizobium psoraleae]|uniref:Multicopper oxidase domain-containing protein n=1 Tax=Sinorhizobium psoraleae TaxID=520838 RepID=A0ABT4KNB6_9HYPH|nr:multicopper oxidase domain-containing protein [Sinorhizobium psoraleae]MCZ4093457.1 multicopper oxidase domain-containing protein [Sinorhizobium psoraleae]